MIACGICGFTNICTYDPVSDAHDFSDFVDIEVHADDLTWEKSAPHMTPYIHKKHLGGSTYE